MLAMQIFAGWKRQLYGMPKYDSVSQRHSALQLWGGQATALDPFALVHTELESVSERLRRSVFTEIPALSTAAEYFFKLGAEGKRLRPTMLLLMASALSAASPSASFLQVLSHPPWAA